jgi:peptidyl-prolyl cis-trans isomerase C
MLREPLLHFVVLGGLAFLAHHFLFEAGPSRTLSPEDAPIEQLREDWFSAKGALPSEDQEAALVRDWLEEEILYRRAVELGLDQNDTIVRRRLVQRMRFLLEDTSRIDPPSEAQLQSWLDQNPGKYAESAKISFTQLFFSRGKRGTELARDARSALDLLQSDPDATVESDPFFRGRHFENATPDEIRRAFGADFAESLAGAPVGRWSGPVRSSYGLHLVRVNHRVPATTATLDEVRKKVETDWMAAERTRRNEEAMARLRARYSTEAAR